MDECLICKRHYTQGGKCLASKKNCLLFEEEPRGKMIRGTFRVEMNMNAETVIIKPLCEKKKKIFKLLNFRKRR